MNRINMLPTLNKCEEIDVKDVKVQKILNHCKNTITTTIYNYIIYATTNEEN